jgi:hypothetical protein
VTVVHTETSPRHRMSTAAAFTRLMAEIEDQRAEICWLRDENGRLWAALRRYEPAAPVNPFPRLAGEDVLAILHPDDRRGRPCPSR